MRLDERRLYQVQYENVPNWRKDDHRWNQDRIDEFNSSATSGSYLC